MCSMKAVAIAPVAQRCPGRGAAPEQLLYTCIVGIERQKGCQAHQLPAVSAKRICCAGERSGLCREAGQS